jgi:hypothetical protein
MKDAEVVFVSYLLLNDVNGGGCRYVERRERS